MAQRWRAVDVLVAMAPEFADTSQLGTLPASGRRLDGEPCRGIGGRLRHQSLAAERRYQQGIIAARTGQRFRSISPSVLRAF